MRADYILKDGLLLTGEVGVVWTDFDHPTSEEESGLEEVLGVDLPTREEMAEIESSSRIYTENGALFLTASLLSGSETERPVLAPVTFVLHPTRLVTIRYHTPSAFRSFVAHAGRSRAGISEPFSLLMALLEAVVDRLADVLEREAKALDGIATTVFGVEGAKRKKPGALRAVIGRIGQRGELNAQIRDSLASLDRIAGHLAQFPGRQGVSPEIKEQAQTLVADVRSLTEYAGGMSGRIAFLLDATLGLVNLEQNDIIKFFSVVAVVFLPPTLVGTVYGINFADMPELAEPWGYPAALGAMLVSAVVPYLWFKWRGWF